ncbi:MAG: RNA 2',3'-cyclic phosphodiesterase [Nitrospirota bacterium]
MYLRCFIAIDIPVPVKNDIGGFIDTLKKYDADVRWVVYENLHLTLKFLGRTPEVLLLKIKGSLSNIVLSYEPFYIKICSAGVFPNRKYPRVIWVGIKDSEILKRLRRDIEDSMILLNYQKENREFSPHLTVGRVRSQKGVADMIRGLDNFKERDFGGMEVNSIKLMKSELKPTGAQYYCLAEIPLGRRKDD